MAKNDKLNEIMIQLAVIDEKLDNIKDDLKTVEELEEKVSDLEKFRAYTKGAAVVSVAGISTLVAGIFPYFENLMR